MWIFTILPAWGEGTSSVALPVSTWQMAWSFSMVSPSLTKSSAMSADSTPSEGGSLMSMGIV
jgi:hypothetical protein